MSSKITEALSAPKRFVSNLFKTEILVNDPVIGKLTYNKKTKIYNSLGPIFNGAHVRIYGKLTPEHRSMYNFIKRSYTKRLRICIRALERQYKIHSNDVVFQNTTFAKIKSHVHLVELVMWKDRCYFTFEILHREGPNHKYNILFDANLKYDGFVVVAPGKDS